MSKFRLEAITDAVMAIVMTLLVIEIRVPELEHFSESELWHKLEELAPLFYAFFLSFAVLASYWTIHNFLITLMSKNVNRLLAYLNFLFLAFISLVPFSSHLLGRYPESQTAVAVYSLNVLVIAVMLFVLREYIIRSRSISNPEYKEIGLTAKDRLYGTLRIMISLVSSVVAIPLSYVSTQAAIVLLVVPVVFGVVPGLVGFASRVTGLDKFAKEIDEL